jgi:hypothetical protein
MAFVFFGIFQSTLKLVAINHSHLLLVGIATPANALSAGVPDSYKIPSLSLRLGGSIFFGIRMTALKDMNQPQTHTDAHRQTIS